MLHTYYSRILRKHLGLSSSSNHGSFSSYLEIKQENIHRRAASAFYGSMYSPYPCQGPGPISHPISMQQSSPPGNAAITFPTVGKALTSEAIYNPVYSHYAYSNGGNVSHPVPVQQGPSPDSTSFAFHTMSKALSSLDSATVAAINRSWPSSHTVTDLLNCHTGPTSTVPPFV